MTIDARPKLEPSVRRLLILELELEDEAAGEANCQVQEPVQLIRDDSIVEEGKQQPGCGPAVPGRLQEVKHDQVRDVSDPFCIAKGCQWPIQQPVPCVDSHALLILPCCNLQQLAGGPKHKHW